MSTHFDIAEVNKRLDAINRYKVKIETLNNNAKNIFLQEKVQKNIDIFPDGEIVLCPTCIVT